MFTLRLIFKSLSRNHALFGLWILSLGVAVTGLLIVDVFRHSLTETLKLKGAKILTADVSLSTRRALTGPEHESVVHALPATTRYTELTEMMAMVSHFDGDARTTRLSSVRFVEDAYPLVGDLVIDRGEVSSATQVSGVNLGLSPQAWVAPDLLTLMKVKVGDSLQIGELSFVIAGLIRKDSSQTFRFGNMAPRIFLHRRYLEMTKLIKFGSTFSQTLFAKLAEPDAAVKAKIEKILSDPAIEVTTPNDLEQGSFRVLSRLLDFLGLTGLVTLCLGWIAVYYLGRRWLSLEAGPSGILKCLGFSARELRSHLLLKLTLILVAGVVSGGVLAWLGAHAVLPFVESSLPAEFTLIWSWPSTLLLALIGPLAGILLMLPSIRGMANDQPLLLIQGVTAFRTRFWDFVAFSLTTALLFFMLTFAQARSWRVTIVFLGAMLGTVVVVGVLGYGFVFFTRKIRRAPSAWRSHLAISFWSRRAALSMLMITVSAMSGLLSQLVPNIERTLVGELQSPPDLQRPGLFLFDIQDDQLSGLDDLFKTQKIEVSQQAPLIRARILKVNGHDFERNKTGTWSTREDEMDARFRNRGVNLSYRETLGPSEKILEGRNWSARSRDLKSTEISVESGFADRLKLKRGDVLRFDVQGNELDAKIVNLRLVDWNSFEPNFFILFPPGVLDEAPKTWMVTLKLHPTLTPPQIQTLIFGLFPNVTSINIQQALDNISELFTKLSAGLKLASGLCLALGIFVFLMILLFQLASSQSDWLQLKILGLRTRDVLTLQVFTYGTLCVVGLILGSLLSIAVAAVMSHFAFDAHLSLDWLKMGQIFIASLASAGLGMAILAWTNGRSSSLNSILGESVDS